MNVPGASLPESPQARIVRHARERLAWRIRHLVGFHPMSAPCVALLLRSLLAIITAVAVLVAGIWLSGEIAAWLGLSTGGETRLASTNPPSLAGQPIALTDDEHGQFGLATLLAVTVDFAEHHA
jgi:hypothetical protein